MSDPVSINELPTLEQRMDDVRAVMDAVGFKRAVLVRVLRRWTDVAPVRRHLPGADDRPHSPRDLRQDGVGRLFAERLVETTPSNSETMIEERWADGFPGLDVWAPTFADSEQNRQAFAHFSGQAANPAPRLSG